MFCQLTNKFASFPPKSLNMQRPTLVIFHVILPLFVGGLIYISFRSKSLTMFNWFNTIGISGFTNSIRIFFNPMNNYLPSWVFFSLPDGLWVYSFSSSFIIVWDENFKVARLWLVIPLLTGCFAEILQLFKIIPGTFDSIDFLICLCASFLSKIIVQHKMKIA